MYERNIEYPCLNRHCLLLFVSFYEILFTLIISNTEISKYFLISKIFPIFFSFQIQLFQTTSISEKFSGPFETRKFTLRYQKFELYFNFEISRVDCSSTLTLLHSERPKLFTISAFYECNRGKSRTCRNLWIWKGHFRDTISVRQV